MKTVKKRQARTYEFTRTKINDVLYWMVPRGQVIGIGKTKGRALLNLLNKLNKAEVKLHDKMRKQEYGVRPTEYEE